MSSKTLFFSENSQPLGSGTLYPAKSVIDPELAKMVGDYKRRVASRYRSLSTEEIEQLPSGQLLVSPKIDGELWFLFIEDEKIALISPTGKVIRGQIPLLEEAAKIVMPRARGRLVLAGELFSLAPGGGRPRVGDLAPFRRGGVDAPVDRLGFQAFDLLSGGDEEHSGAMVEYNLRLECMRRLFKGGKRVQAIRTESCTSHEQVRALFTEWVEGGKGEGLVVRSEEFGRTYKVKPMFTIDAAIIAYTERADEEDQVRSLLLALMREDGHFHVLGSCGNLGTPDDRAAMHARISGDAIESGYSYASSSGALFKFVRPKHVIEIKVTDIQGEDSSGDPVQRMVLRLDEDRWTALSMADGVSILHPVMTRLREDKEVNKVDVRAAQVLERVFVGDLDREVKERYLEPSEIIRREVYTKTTKGKVAVRKLLVWKTNKEATDPRFPAYVVHYTDYSPGRKDPITREVQRASDEELALQLADAVIAEKIKTGWKPA